MSFLNWTPIIPRYHGEFMYEEDMNRYCEFWQSLKPGAHAECKEDEDEFLVLPEYEEDVVKARHEWSLEEGGERELRALHSSLERRSRLDNLLKPVVFWRLTQYPRWSSLPHHKHRFIVNMMRRWSVTGLPTNPTPNERKLVDEFRKVSEEMRAEQLEFLKFTDNVSSRSLSLYNRLDLDTTKYADNYVRSRQRRVGWYPRYYTELKRVPLAARDNRSETLLPVGEALDLGVIPFCNIPNMTKHICFDRAVKKLTFRYPTDSVYPSYVNGKRVPLDGRYLYKQPVSRDPNALRLCRALPVDFVATPSALKQLLSRAPLHGDAWHVPVTVRIVDSVDGKTQRRVVFLDKPLSSGKRTAVSVKQLVINRAVRSLLCKQLPDGVRDYSAWSDEQIAKHEASKKKRFGKMDGESVANDIVDGVSSVSADNELEQENSDSENSSCSDTDKLTIEDDEEDEEMEMEEESSLSVEVDSPSDRPDDPPTTSPSSTSVKAADECNPAVERPAESGFLDPDPHTAVNYRVWKLGGFHVLVRSITHGMRESSVSDRRLVRYTLHARLCHLACYGVPVMTASELLGEWLDCVLRPESRVLRVYVEPHSRRLVATEERSLQQLQLEFAKYGTGFEPARGLGSLGSLLGSLAPLVPGTYLLAYERDCGLFARLMCDEKHPEAVGKSEWLDLRSRHCGGLKVLPLSQSPALPIDTSVLTPYNIRFGFAPGLFQCRISKKVQLEIDALNKRRKFVDKSQTQTPDKTPGKSDAKKKKKKKTKKKEV